MVKEVISMYEKAGSHNINFNASGLSSGIYYYKIESGSRSIVKKMMLLR